MISANQAIGEFVESIQGVTDLDVLRKKFQIAVNRLGIVDYSYHIVRAQGITEQLVCGIITYPEDWVQHYIDQGMVDYDPIVKTGRRNNLPFRWSQLRTSPDEIIAQKQVNLMNEAAGLGLSEGMTVPIHGHREFAMLSVVPDHDADDRNQVLVQHQDIFHLLSLYFHDHTRDLVIEQIKPAVAPKLTNREKECLKWTAEGKTAWEIAQILSISERTVVYYLENAKHKLGVNSRPHAVVKAVMSGLIDLA